MNYIVSIIDNFDDFISASEQWDILACKCEDSFPFMCHDWFKVWLNNFGDNKKLNMLIFSDEAGLLSIVPLMKIDEKYRGCKIKILETIGNTYSPFGLFIFNSKIYNQANKSIEAFFSCLFKMPDSSWDVLKLDSIPEESDFYTCLTNFLTENHLPFIKYSCFGDWYQNDIDCTGDEFLAHLPEKIRKDLQYCKRRLEREGNLEFRVIAATKHLEDHLDAYYGVYGRSWQKQERIGPSFHRDLARVAAERGWLRLAFLFHNDVPLAAQFWIVSGSTAYILKTVYDQDYKKYSPGKILTSEMFKYVIDVDGVTAVDYVQGDEDYKKDWTPKRRERRGILVYNATVRGRCLSFVDRKIVPFVNGNSRLRRLKLPLSRLVRPRG